MRELPKLFYAGDVPVIDSVAGSLALFRLLHSYPADRLTCVHLRGGPLPSDGRLSGVHYQSFLLPFDRLQRTRLHNVIKPPAQLLRRFYLAPLRRIAERFGAEAILTVADGEGWLAASELSCKLNLPLHLVVHDGNRSWGGLHPLTGRIVERNFISAYRSAASRFCVSSRMEATYRELTGAPGTVLYPTWGPNAKVYTTLPARVEKEIADPVAVHFGTINSPSIVALLISLAEVLSTVSGRLILVGPPSLHVQRSKLLRRGNVEYRGYLPSRDAVAQLCREEATFLYLPFSFEDAGAGLSFPSKFVDYTGMALPVIVQAPPQAPIVDWIRDNPGTVQFVETRDQTALRHAILEVSRDCGKARDLARNVAAKGRRYFDQETVSKVFHAALRRAHERTVGDAACSVAK